MLFGSLALGDVDARAKQSSRPAILQIEPSFQINPAFLAVSVQDAEFILERSALFPHSPVESFNEPAPGNRRNSCGCQADARTIHRTAANKSRDLLQCPSRSSQFRRCPARVA